MGLTWVMVDDRGYVDTSSSSEVERCPEHKNKEKQIYSPSNFKFGRFSHVLQSEGHKFPSEPAAEHGGFKHK